MDAYTRAPVPRYAYSLDEAAHSISISRRVVPADVAEAEVAAAEAVFRQLSGPLR
jgi:hypothetical protein